MIRKLILGGSAFAVAVMALLLVTVGGGAKSADAHVTSIVSNPSGGASEGSFVEVRVFAVDGHGDVYITASAGTFWSCEDDDNNPCIPNAVSPFPFVSGIVSDASDTDELELIWQAPLGFPGGAVTFFACQQDEAQDSFSNWPFITCDSGKSMTLQILGSPATIELFAQRGYSNEPSSSECADTPVYVIAAFQTYTFNDFTTFNNDRAIICAEVRDSVGHPLAGENVQWSVSGGGCLDDSVNNTLTNGIVHNRLTSCNTGDSGDIATVTAMTGTATGSTKVQFGGDAASCTLVVTPDTDLDIGDTGAVVATFLDAKGNWVPDGIEVHFVEVDSGDGGDNVQLVSTIEDTVKGQAGTSVIAAISGVTTIAAVMEHVAGIDTTCSDEILLTGDIHAHPLVCSDPDYILNGFVPPAAGGFGTFEFCGGTFAQLLTASKCPAATSAFFYNKPDGGWAVWIPGAEVAAVNAPIMAMWPEQVPPHTIFTAKCKG